jgi:putative Ca2+/H+ antiporter (TMEM165/GDT1 family)
MAWPKRWLRSFFYLVYLHLTSREEKAVQAYWASLALVLLAEMGDKTQLLAMAFATRFRWHIVLVGIFVAIAADHLIAVMVGHYLGSIIPIQYVKIGTSVSFILFGLWTLRGDKLRGKENSYKFSPFWTITVAFFIAEMGDKTQLATVALAAKYNSILSVWLGTTTGMLLADAIGIIVGIVLGKKIPERMIKWGSALIFIGFGIFGLYESLFQ